MSAALSIQQLSVELAGKQLLARTNFDFQPGKLYIVIGPNGAGKSTLLKAMTGVINASGCVLVHGRALNEWPKRALARHLGVLPQSSSLSFPFSVREVVMMGSMALNQSRSSALSTCARLMDELEISHLADRHYPGLSGGEKQRVHFARVLMQLSSTATEQQILLLDEPTSALDITFQHTLLMKAKRLASSGACVMAIIHDLNLASEYADELIALKDGKVVAVGDNQSMIQKDNIQAIYGWHGAVITNPYTGNPVVVSG